MSLCVWACVCACVCVCMQCNVFSVCCQQNLNVELLVTRPVEFNSDEFQWTGADFPVSFFTITNFHCCESTNTIILIMMNYSVTCSRFTFLLKKLETRCSLVTNM